MMSPLEMDIAIVMSLVLLVIGIIFLVIGIIFVVKSAFGKEPEGSTNQPRPTAAPSGDGDSELIERIRKEAEKHSMRVFGRRPGKISIK